MERDRVLDYKATSSSSQKEKNLNWFAEHKWILNKWYSFSVKIKLEWNFLLVKWTRETSSKEDKVFHSVCQV